MLQLERPAELGAVVGLMVSAMQSRGDSAETIAAATTDALFTSLDKGGWRGWVRQPCWVVVGEGRAGGS